MKGLEAGEREELWRRYKAGEDGSRGIANALGQRTTNSVLRALQASGGTLRPRDAQSCTESTEPKASVKRFPRGFGGR